MQNVPARVQWVRRSRPLQRKIEAAITVENLTPHQTIPGSVWGVCLVKDEADIIEHTVRHFLNQGFDGLIVVDHGSTDATPDLLHSLAVTDARLFVGADREPAYHQGRKTSYLAHLAWSAGADWIVPFDADEHWFAVGQTVPEFLRATKADVVECAMYNLQAAATQDVLDLTTAQTLQMETSPTGWAKVAFRAKPWVWVLMGNHGVSRPGIRVKGLNLQHFPYRSPEQLSRKVVDGSSAIVQAFGRRTGFASHWRALAELSAEDLRDRWEAYLQGSKMNANSERVRRVSISAVEPWLTWDPRRELTAEPPKTPKSEPTSESTPL